VTDVTSEPVDTSTVEAVDGQLIGMLVDRARAGGLQLTGEGGLLQQLTKRVLESALEGEMTDHLGYEKHDPGRAGRRQQPQRQCLVDRPVRRARSACGMSSASRVSSRVAPGAGAGRGSVRPRARAAAG
jgi:hypothetical protein